MRDRAENAIEWLLTFAESKALDFVIIAIILLTIGYMIAQVVRWLS